MSRAELVDRLVDVFYKYGYDGATLSVISAATGLRRASIYHYFPGGKQEMAEAVLAHSDRWAAENVRAMLDSELAPEKKVRNMCAMIDQVHTRPDQLTLMNVFSYGTARILFGAQVRVRVESWLDSIATLLKEIGFDDGTARARALQAYIRIEGAMVLARSLDDLCVFRQTMQSLPNDLLAGVPEQRKPPHAA